jgi:hypothetical protein
MYDNSVTLMAHTAAEAGYGRRDAAEKARRQALSLFGQAYVAGKVVSLMARLTGRSSRLHKLAGNSFGNGRQAPGVRTIDLNRIRGSEGRSEDFDSAFRPRQLHTRDRWLSVAAARILNIPLPPVDLIEVGDSYYVRDGNHRISVARALGQASIEATVTVRA